MAIFIFDAPALCPGAFSLPMRQKRLLCWLRDRLASLPLSERRDVTGLEAGRAPTIVAGTVVLLEVLGAFGLNAVEVSERDILWGVALDSTFET